jgi:hypothetical protein
VPPARLWTDETPFGREGSLFTTFVDRFQAVRTTSRPLSWGIDPSREVLEAWGVGDMPDGLHRFADVALDAACGTDDLVKLQAGAMFREGSGRYSV